VKFIRLSMMCASLSLTVWSMVSALQAHSIAATTGPGLDDDRTSMQRESRFGTCAVWIDTSDSAMSADQIVIRAVSGDVRIVGIEGGDHERLVEPPYYDPEAMQQDRVVIADFSTATEAELPSGRQRLVTLHYMAMGPDEAAFDAAIEVAIDDEGRDVAAQLELSRGASE